MPSIFVKKNKTFYFIVSCQMIHFKKLKANFEKLKLNIMGHKIPPKQQCKF